MKIEDLTIAQIRDAQALSRSTVSTIGEWKRFWKDFATKHNLTDKDAVKVAQNRF